MSRYQPNYETGTLWPEKVNLQAGEQDSLTPLPGPSSLQQSTIEERPTVGNLGWEFPSSLLNRYDFKVPRGPRGEDPYFELKEGFSSTHLAPARVFLDSSKSPNNGRYPCLFPGGCTVKPFKRHADLVRHYRSVHSNFSAEQWLCDYSWCNRSGESFTRKDHIRDHLTYYHKEDIGCARRSRGVDEYQWNLIQKEWLAERIIFKSWWRCAGCFTRGEVEVVGWKCSYCKRDCEPERRLAREKRYLRQRGEEQHMVAAVPFDRNLTQIEVRDTAVGGLAPLAPGTGLVVGSQVEPSHVVADSGWRIKRRLDKIIGKISQIFPRES